MTIGLALKYDKGVLLLADTEVIDGHSFRRLQDADKTYQFGNNIVFSGAGNFGDLQQIGNIMNEISNYINCAIEDYVNGQMNGKSGTKNKKPKGHVDLESAIRMLSAKKYEFFAKKREDELDIFVKEQRMGDVNNSLEMYFDREGINFYVQSCGGFIRSIMREKDIKETEFLITGIDKKGKQIYFVGGGFVLLEEKNYRTIGIPWQTSETMMDALYKESITEKEALLLAVYVGIYSKKHILGVNDRFSVTSIKENNGCIESRIVPEDEINHFKRMAEIIKPDFPYNLAK